MDTASSASGAAPVPRPLRRDAELNRRRIMEAARLVFAERGLEATLDEVARQAGVGVGTVYRRFPDKEALVDALFEESFGQVVTLAERALELPDAWEGVIVLLTELAETQAADRGLRDIMLSESYGHDRVAQMRDRIKPLLERMVERAQQQGGLRADLRAGDLPAILMMISVTVEFGGEARPDLWRRYLTLLLDGICAHRDGPTALPESELEDEDMPEAMRAWPRLRRMAPPGADRRGASS
jgi:AcrR family transcriptional regulator